MGRYMCLLMTLMLTKAQRVTRAGAPYTICQGSECIECIVHKLCEHTALSGVVD